jgi:signal transduction histidine kinase
VPATVDTEMSQLMRYESVALVLLRRAEHVLFSGLLVLGTVRAATGDHAAVAVLVAVTVGAWYGLGVRWRRRAERRRWYAPLWLLVLTAGWVALIVISADYVWLAFALYLLALQALPAALTLVGVGLIAAAAIAAFVAHRGMVDVAAVLGPLIGAAVAVVMTRVYRGLREEAEVRTRLLQELTAAQDQLAAAERHAGGVAERERLAREIHDTVAQSLSSIILLLHAVARSWQQAPPTSRERIGTAITTAQTALEDTRRLVRALTPAQLAGQPLAEALRRLCDNTRALGLDARLTIDGQEYALPTPVEVTLLRVGQEALANVRTHAQAGHVTVTLTYLPDSVNLDVVDDGRGFDPEQAPVASPTAGTGLGLTAMRTRLNEVGGALAIESMPGHGTALSASIPAAGA